MVIYNMDDVMDFVALKMYLHKEKYENSLKIPNFGDFVEKKKDPEAFIFIFGNNFCLARYFSPSLE